MQRITYRAKASARGAKRRISSVLRPSKRLLNTKSNIVPVVAPIKVARFAKTNFSKTKKLAQVSSIAMLSLPAESLMTMGAPIPAYDHVMLENTLTIAAVPGDSTYFATDGFQHGFGFNRHRLRDPYVFSLERNRRRRHIVHDGKQHQRNAEQQCGKVRSVA